MALSSAIAIEKLPVRESDVVIPKESTAQLQTGAMIGENTRPGADVHDAINNGQFIPAGHRHEALEPPSTASRPAPLPSSPLIFEALYKHLGRWTGRYGSRQAQGEVLRGWIQRGEDGAFWLVRRVVKESNLEALDGASIALEAMSAVA